MTICNKCGLPKEKVCKPCKSEADRVYRQKNRERLAEYFKKLWKDPNRRAANKVYKERSRFGINAEEYVKNKSCESCGVSNSDYKIKTGRRLDINHIDDMGRKAIRLGDKVNNNINNFMVACRSCHTTWHNKNIRDYSESNKHEQSSNSANI